MPRDMRAAIGGLASQRGGQDRDPGGRNLHSRLAPDVSLDTKGGGILDDVEDPRFSIKDLLDLLNRRRVPLGAFAP